MESNFKTILEQDDWLSKLSIPAKTAFIAAIRITHYDEGKIIFSEGDIAESFLGLLDGQVSISRLTVDGHQSSLTHLVPIYWLGEMSFLDGQPRSHHAIAITDVVLAVVPASEMRRLMEMFPEIYKAMVHQLCRHTRQVYSAIDDFLLMSPERLLAKRILELLDVSATEGEIQISQDGLARLTGISRQSTNRILGGWEKKNLIERSYRKLSIKNFEGLRLKLIRGK